MATGTSVIGSQLCIDNGGWTDRYMFFNVMDSFGGPPRRLGFYWVALYRTDPDNESAIVDRGALFSAGLYIRLPDLKTNSPNTYRLWVDWNEAGLDWFGTFFL